ncbi:MAG: histidine kinase [Gammaproteobacteria bacterium]|nr:MAG: histidine kinase [Gammaproteobacteria bacterium]
MKVIDLMTGPAEKLVCAKRDMTLDRLASLISHHNVGALPIVDDDGGLCGMISERDIVRALALDGHAALALKASELMIGAVITCRPAASYEVARKLMLKHHIRHLPITDDDGGLIGILSQRDLVTLYGASEQANEAA